MSVARGLWLAVGLGMIACVEGDQVEAWISRRYQQGCWDPGFAPNKRGDWAFEGTMSLRTANSQDPSTLLVENSTGCMFNLNAMDSTVDEEGVFAYVSKSYAPSGTQVCLYYKAKEDDGVNLGCADNGILAQCVAEKFCCASTSGGNMNGTFDCEGLGSGGAGTVATVTWRKSSDAPTLAPTGRPTSPTEVPLATVATIDVPAGWQVTPKYLPYAYADVGRESYEIDIDQFSTLNNQFSNNSHGKADFWWVNRSMRGATVFDITPVPATGEPSVFPVNSSFTVNCSVPNDQTTCDVFTFIYHNPPISSTTNGGLISLVDDGWEASSCAPSFRLHSNVGGAFEECFYHMVAMRNTINNGESVTVKMEERPGAFVLFAVVPKAVCRNTMTEAECAATHTDDGPLSTCAFVDNACFDNWCARRHTTRPPDFTRPPTLNCPAANAGL